MVPVVFAPASWMECVCHPRLDKGHKGQGGHFVGLLFDLCRPELGEGLDNEPPLP